VAGLRAAYGASERRACRALAFPRASHRYASRRDPQDTLRVRLRDLAGARFRYGYRRLHILLRREGWGVNHKRVYRLYSEEGLAMRKKAPRRHASSRARSERPVAEAANRAWAMDFLSDALSDGRRFRVLTVVDTFTREGPAARADFRFTGDQVVAALEGLAAERGAPASIRVDNGPEFVGRSLDLWAYFNGVTPDFSRPGKPTDNAYIEAFNGRLRQECLDPHWFLCLDDAREKIEAWRTRYNREHPHSALGYLTPGEFAATKAGRKGPKPIAKLSL
jgi:putative transposase